MSPDDPLPPLILRCRPGFLVLYAASSILLLAAGTACLAGLDAVRSGAWLTTVAPPILLALGAATGYFVGRYCLARLILDDEGFRLIGPLGGCRVSWGSVVRWERRRQRGGPATLRILHGPDGRLLTIPLIYEESDRLEEGLEQGRFPRD